MNKDELPEYRDYLLYLANGGEPHNVMYGTCDSFEDEFEDLISNVIRDYYLIIQEFEYYSGNRIWCIKGETDDPIYEYTMCDNLWIGEYGRRRRLFCKFLADYLDKIINDYTMNKMEQP